MRIEKCLFETKAINKLSHFGQSLYKKRGKPARQTVFDAKGSCGSVP